MKTPKNTKKRKNKGSNDGGAKQFLVWHGEKVAVAIIAVFALWFAVQGMGYMGQRVSWPPGDLETVAREARETIEKSTRTAEDEFKDKDLKLTDYAAYAEQIKEPISAAPYGNKAPWKPLGSP